eukprot:TRINITY_DN70363_c0_g1_i1.p1 TRINITY_DN70363_c0_g1~~TRINITY_DN70363_c0_g1_i1.p1  ORF type:complete len:245 (+),score=54.28 TRINITY_DN70363_c0_g1_i1:92-826(+)
MGVEADDDGPEEDGEDEEEEFCCRPSTGGFMFACSYSLCTILLALCILMLQSVAEYQRQIGQIVDAKCALQNNDFIQGDDECVGVLAAQFQATSCWASLNVTRYGSLVVLPHKVRLVFRSEDGDDCGGLKLRRLRGATEAVQDESEDGEIDVHAMEAVQQRHGRSLSANCESLLPTLYNKDFDCSYLPKADDKGVIFDDRILVMKASDLDGDSVKFIALAIILVILVLFCFIALLCHYISKTMA